MRTAQIAVLVVTILFAPIAHAAHYEVYLDSSTLPGGSSQSDYEFATQQTLRVLEQGSGGSANFRWMGSVAGATCAPGRMVIRFGTLGANDCAYTDPVQIILGCASITFNNTMNSWVPRPHPSTLQFARCRSFGAILTHEIAHVFHNVPNVHGWDTVRQNCFPALCGQDLLARHLWNRDMRVDIDRVFYPPRTLGFRVSTYDPSTLAESAIEQSYPGGLAQPIQALSDGSATGYPNAALMAWAYVRANYGAGGSGWLQGIYFQAGNTVSQPLYGAVLTGYLTENYTDLPLCLASDDLGHYLLAWASGNEGTPTDGGNTYLTLSSGARAVYFATSANGGTAWTTAAAIPGAFTRAGVTCSFDVQGNNFVVAYTGSGEEGLWVTHRSVGGSTWASVSQLGPAPGRSTVPSSIDTPNVAFLVNPAGSLAWVDNVDGPLVGEIVLSGSAYTWTSTPVRVPTIGGDERQLRSRMAVRMGLDGPHVAYDINNYNTTRGHVRARLLPTRTEAYESDTLTSYRRRYSHFARTANYYPDYAAVRLMSQVWSGAE